MVNSRFKFVHAPHNTQDYNARDLLSSDGSTQRDYLDNNASHRPHPALSSSAHFSNRTISRKRLIIVLQFIAVFCIFSLFKLYAANGRSLSDIPDDGPRDGTQYYSDKRSRFKRDISKSTDEDISSDNLFDHLKATTLQGSSEGTDDRKLAISKVKRQIRAGSESPQERQNISEFSSIIGVRVEGDRTWITDDFKNVIPASSHVNIRLFGLNLSNETLIGFTTKNGSRGEPCDNFDKIHVAQLKLEPDNNNVGSISVQLPITEKDLYYICVNTPLSNSGSNKGWTGWTHQGYEPWVLIRAEGRLLPISAQVIIIILLLCLSGLFSGLNLGLMALDKNELMVIASCGTDTEKNYAKAIAPVRKRGNYLLCSLLLGNVLVNSTLTILLDDISSGLVAIIVSTFGIVVFGEIIPQAICSRHGLAVGAKTVFLTYIFMIVTFPLSYPISKILDKCLGEEIGNVYDRERLMEYIRVTRQYNQLETDEVNIIYGALRLKQIKVSEIMTRLEDVFMLPHDAILDFDTMNLIQSHGFSRVPIYERERVNIIALLFMKDLAFVDPDDCVPVANIIGFYKHPIVKVFEDATLDIALNEFKRGLSHMAFVQKVVDDGERDPHYQIIGVVTLEDVIEEVLQAEIIDETDVLTDNRMKKKRKDAQVRQDFSDFGMLNTDSNGGGAHFVSPQLALAAYQYLSTSVYPFDREFISENTLRKLMSKDIYFQCKVDTVDASTILSSPFEQESKYMLYKIGEPVDYFIMILEGRVRVAVGNEKLMFESGPFSYFGCAALILNRNDRKVSTISRADSNVGKGQAHAFPSITTANPSVGSETISPASQVTGLNLDLRKDSSMISSPTNMPASVPTTLPNGHPNNITQGNLIAKKSIPTQTISGLPLHSSTDIFKPDYSVQCIESTTYIKISRKVYLQVFCASMMERKQTLTSIEDETLRREIDAAIGVSSLNPALSQQDSNPNRSGRSTPAGGSPVKIRRSPSNTTNPPRHSTDSNPSRPRTRHDSHGSVPVSLGMSQKVGGNNIEVSGSIQPPVTVSSLPSTKATTDPLTGLPFTKETTTQNTNATPPTEGGDTNTANTCHEASHLI